MEKNLKVKGERRKRAITWTQELLLVTKKPKQECETQSENMDGPVQQDDAVNIDGSKEPSDASRSVNDPSVSERETLINSSYKQLSHTFGSVVKYERQHLGLNVHYHPHFMQFSNKCFRSLEAELHEYFHSSPNIVKVFGKTYNIPRRQTAFGDPGISYSFSGITLSAKPWTTSIRRLKVIIEEATNEVYNLC